VFSVPPLTPFVKKLLIALFAAFVIELLLQRFAGVPVLALLALDPVHLSPLTIAQLVTYVFVEEPRALTSMLIGLFFMWLILSPFESTFGARHTFELAIAGTLGASVLVVLVALFAPTPFPLFGSFPIAYAGMAAMTQVMRGGKMMFFGVLPMTSRQLMYVLVGLSVLQYLISSDLTALVASLGSMIAGGGYVRYMARPRRPTPPKRPGAARFRVLRGGGGNGDGDGDRPKWLN
jgi:hypothetical protein